MNRKTRNILLTVFVLGLMLVYGADKYLYLLSTRTIENLEVKGNISSYGYSWDFEFLILESQIKITNIGPLDITLHDSNCTVSLNNESIIIPIDYSMKIPSGSSNSYMIAPPDLVIKDESHTILENIEEYFFNYTITLNAYASCGKYEVPVKKSYTSCLVYLHPPPYELPLLLQHGMFPGAEVNETFVVHPSQQMLPQSFRVGYLSDAWTNREHIWGLSMKPQEKIRFSFNATEPVHFQLILSRNHDFNRWSKEKVLIDLSSTSSFDTNFTAPEEGLYVLAFKISQEDLTATVILDGVSFWP